MELCHRLAAVTIGLHTSARGFELVSEEKALPTALLNLVCLRASQVQASAACIARYWGELREAGESEHRLYLLDAWREAAVFTKRERAALAFTESLLCVTHRSPRPSSDRDLIEHLTASEQLELTRAITRVTSWNRLGIAFPHADAA
ncbi:MAG TPA: carboxymuconolactone decarboxylase family protein [Candidatus Eisenbacteria bacterium]|nr:carboxymuconolactone decarboxylase family protein [Candidatus Eisenbacteria bacterium]